MSETITGQVKTPAGAHARVSPERVPLLPDEPATLVEVIERALARHARPDTLSYKRENSWRAVSSAEFRQRARRIALGLHSLGVRAPAR
jgi:long-subunit acyl-CoA synthetase (AMP-forming)